MLSRLRANPVIRTVLLAVALGFCVFGLVHDWPEVHTAVRTLDSYSVGASFLAAAAGSGCMILAWRAILADLGSPLTVPAAVRIVSISQVAKYLPGALWAFAAQVELGRDYRVPRRRSAAAVLVSLAVALATGLAIGTATLPAASSGAARHYRWIMVLAPIIALGLLPPVLRRLLNRAFRLARRQPLERPPSIRGLAVAVGWSVSGWLFWGLHAWLLIASLTGRSANVVLLALGSYALAWCAGILLIVFPGGIGPRELAFVVALAPVMPRGSALLIALISRAVMTISDVMMACAGLVIGRLTRRSRAAAADDRPLHAGNHGKPRSIWLPPDRRATAPASGYASLDAADTRID